MGSRRPGRPKDTWHRTIQKDMRDNGIGAEDVESRSVDLAEQIEEDSLLTYETPEVR